MVTNSILFGMSSTTNDTSLMAVNPLSYVLVTRSKTTTGGFGKPEAGGVVTSLVVGTMREESELEPVQQSVDPIREETDHNENREDVFSKPAPLARHQ